MKVFCLYPLFSILNEFVSRVPRPWQNIVGLINSGLGVSITIASKFSWTGDSEEILGFRFKLSLATNLAEIVGNEKKNRELRFHSTHEPKSFFPKNAKSC